MPIVRMQLDPDAQSYTDNEIVGKVNTAADKITRADSVEVAAILESATELLLSDTERTKLSGIEENATVKHASLETLPDGATRLATDQPAVDKLAGVEALAEVNPDGGEIRDLVVALGDSERKIVITDPAIVASPDAEHKVVALVRLENGKLDVKYDDVPVT